MALALEQLQTGDLPSTGLIAPGRVGLALTGPRGPSCKPWAKRASVSIPLWVAAVIHASSRRPALPDEPPERLAQLIGLGDRWVTSVQLVDIRLERPRRLRFGT